MRRPKKKPRPSPRVRELLADLLALDDALRELRGRADGRRAFAEREYQRGDGNARAAAWVRRATYDRDVLDFALAVVERTAAVLRSAPYHGPKAKPLPPKPEPAPAAKPPEPPTPARPGDVPYALFPTGCVVLPRPVVEGWAGRRLTDDDLVRLARALPKSSVPESVGTIAFALNPDAAEYAE